MPQQSRIYNVTYMEPTLRVAAGTLKSGASYSARVRAWAQSYNSTWSEWSPSTKWLNREYLLGATSRWSLCPSPLSRGQPLPLGRHRGVHTRGCL